MKVLTDILGYDLQNRKEKDTDWQQMRLIPLIL
jgi:hypothetical protein